jgi:hypothetical protein
MDDKPLIRKEVIFILILIILPLLTFASFLPDFIFPKGSQYSDYTISHYPNLLYLQNVVSSTHSIPLWNNQILSGFPMLADPLAGLWYPGNWLTILFPLPLGTHLVTLLHIISGGLGMYLFLRQRTNTTFAAFLGAMAFELMPKLFIHYAAGHVSLVQAITWTPWLLLLQSRRFLLPQRQARYWYQAGFIYALILLCDLRWVAYAFILDGLFFIYQLCNIKPHPIRQLLIRIAGWISQIIIGMGLAAIFLVPFFEYLTLTDRSQLLAGDILNYALPLGKLMGLIIPDMGGYAEYFIYPGLLVWIAFLGVLSIRPLRKKYTLMYIFIGVCLLYSFGSAIPWLNWIANIPGMNLLRVPSRMFFIMNICFIVMAADYYSSLESASDLKKQVNLLPPFFTLTFAVAICLVIFFTGNPLISDFIWPVIISFLLFILFLLKKYTKKTTLFVNIFLVFVAIIDFTVVNVSQMDIVPAATVLAADQGLYDYLSKNQEIEYRVYSPSYRLEQQGAAYHQVQLVDGVDPLHLKTYAAYMEKASGVPYSGYSVTIPPYTYGQPETDNEKAVPDSKLLGLLNTKYVVSDFPIEASGLALSDSNTNTYIYLNEEFLPRAWLEVDGKIINKDIAIIHENPNKIQLKAIGPGTLVLSEMMYPGWVATINGTRTSIKAAHQILRSVELPKGEAVVEFHFIPTSLMLGASLSAFTLACLLCIEMITYRRRRRKDAK